MKRMAFLLLLGLLAGPFSGSGQPMVRVLLQHFGAKPSSFKKVATSELKFSFGGISFPEGGLIGEEQYTRPGLALVKSYGYYALRASGDRAIRKRLGLTGRQRSNWRDSSWNAQRERDWTGITLTTASDSLLQAFLLEAEALGAREVQPCLRLAKENEVAVEEKMFAIGNAYTLVFRKYFYPEGVRHKVRIALCAAD